MILRVGIVCVAAWVNVATAFAQNPGESSSSTVLSFGISSYRSLLIPLALEEVCKELNISADQLKVLSESFDKHRASFPPFQIFLDSEAGVSDFMRLADKRLRELDQPFKNYVEEVLLPNQRDGLLGAHLLGHGLAGYKHPAICERLKLTDDQVNQIEELIKTDRQRRRDLVTSGTILRAAGSESEFNLSDYYRLSLANKHLSKAQTEILTSMLSRSPKRITRRLSLGF